MLKTWLICITVSVKSCVETCVSFLGRPCPKAALLPGWNLIFSPLFVADQAAFFANYFTSFAVSYGFSGSAIWTWSFEAYLKSWPMNDISIWMIAYIFTHFLFPLYAHIFRSTGLRVICLVIWGCPQQASCPLQTKIECSAGICVIFVLNS